MKNMKYILAALFSVLSTKAMAGDEISFTPTSILFPVTRMALIASEGDKTVEIYSCAGTAAECSIDLMDAAAIQAKFATALSVEEGTYKGLMLETCTSGNNYDVKVKGEVNIGGTLYKTHATNILDSAVATADYVTISFMFCGGKTTNFPTPLTVSSGSTLDLTLFVSTEFAAFGNVASGQANQDCVNDGGTKTVCLNYPDVIAYLGSGTPTVEKYKIADSNGAENTSNALLTVLKDPSASVIGALQKKLMTATSVGYACSAPRPLHRVTSVGANTYNLAQVDTNNSPYLEYPNFQLANHTGTADFWQVPGGAPTVSCNYTAYKQP
ncbi:hypothetical protein [Bdellovibrio bacteriovorus]|uniref:hypothetical protein n=1 Tax=Bdellovibrio TaxID=958 RepID=UPI0035A84D9B